MKKYLKLNFWANLFLSIINNNRGDEATFRMMNVSLNMILLAFFIVLNSIAVRDDQRIMRALGSMTGSFGLLPSGLNPITKTADGILPPMTPMKKVDSLQNLLMERLEKLAIDDGLGKGFGIRSQGKIIVMSLDDTILFRPNSVKLLKNGEELLMEICGLLKDSDNPIMIDGYSVKTLSTSSKRWLSLPYKGFSMLRFMTKECGLQPVRFSVGVRMGAHSLGHGTQEGKAVSDYGMEIFLEEGF